VEAAAAAFFPFTAVATCGSKEKKDGLAAVAGGRAPDARV